MAHDVDRVVRRRAGHPPALRDRARHPRVAARDAGRRGHRLVPRGGGEGPRRPGTSAPEAGPARSDPGSSGSPNVAPKASSASGLRVRGRRSRSRSSASAAALVGGQLAAERDPGGDPPVPRHPRRSPPALVVEARRTGGPPARARAAWTLSWATAWPEVVDRVVGVAEARPPPAGRDLVQREEQRAGARRPRRVAPRQQRTRRRCAASPRRATRNAHGWELPADGAHRAASSSSPQLVVGRARGCRRTTRMLRRSRSSGSRAGEASMVTLGDRAGAPVCSRTSLRG